jgi:hypothetical protein
VCRGINWERQPLEELATIADCVGGAGLAALCHLLAQDHSGWGGALAALPLFDGCEMSRLGSHLRNLNVR